MPRRQPRPSGTCPLGRLERLESRDVPAAVVAVHRLDANPTNAAHVRFEVAFDGPVAGVDASDFEARGELTAARVASVQGSGASYIVTVASGSGSGALGLTVLNDGTIQGAVSPLAATYEGGEVYTLQRRPARTIDLVFSEDHGDVGIAFEDGALHPHIHTEEHGELDSDAIQIVVGPSSLRDTPSGAEFEFLAAGAESYWIPPANIIADLPYLGFAAEEIETGTLASYQPPMRRPPADDRITSAQPYTKLQLVGFRGPDGGHLSIYESGDTGPVVWMATSDGIDGTDVLYIPEGAHLHFTVAFNVPGVYFADMFASAYLDANGNGMFDSGIDPYTESEIVTYVFVVDPPGGPTPIELPADPLPQPSVVSAPTMGGIVVNGTDGTTNFLTPFPGFGGPILTASGDFTGDGIVDLVAAVGSGGPAHVKVLDGVTGEVRMSFFAFDPSFTGGVTIAAGDVDGDGVADLIVGAGAGAGPHVKVFSGATGAEIRSFFAYEANFTGGVSVAAGDLDGDGFADIVTGTLTAAPHVRAFDGLTGAERLSFFAYAPTFTGGVFVAAGDLDGDGRAEIVTGTGFGGGSHVRIFEGTTAEERGGFFAYGSTFLGGVRVAVTDSDGDGRSEIVTGAGPGGGPHVQRFDGQTFAELDSFLAADPTFAGGVFVG